MTLGVLTYGLRGGDREEDPGDDSTNGLINRKRVSLKKGREEGSQFYRVTTLGVMTLRSLYLKEKDGTFPP